MKNFRCFATFLCVAAILLSPAVGGASPKYGGSLTIGFESDVNQADPHKGFSSIEAAVFRLVAEPLVSVDKNRTPQPNLAESWKVSDDGKQWIFQLRKGVKFHNGREMTAQDIKFNFERIRKPETGSTFREGFRVVDTLEVLDRYTVSFNLMKPSGGFLANFYNPNSSNLTILAPECVQKDGKVTKPIGTGPFKWVEWKHKDFIRFEKHKDYWVKGLPFLDEVVIRPVPDQTVRLTSLKAGDLDLARVLPLDEVSKLSKNPKNNVQVKVIPGTITFYTHYNVSKQPFNDVKVRQAVAYAVDKEEHLLGVTFGQGQVLNQVFPLQSPWYIKRPSVKRDLNKARALLKEAGYPNGLDIKITTSNAIPEFVGIAEILQAQLEQIGIRAKLDLFDWPTTVKKWRVGEFSLSVAGWLSFYDPELIYPRCFIPKGSAEYMTGNAYNNPELTRLIQAGGRESDQAKRKVIYAQALDIMLEDLPWMFIIGTGIGVGWRDHVKGYDPTATVLVYSDGGIQYTWLDK